MSVKTLHDVCASAYQTIRFKVFDIMDIWILRIFLKPSKEPFYRGLNVLYLWMCKEKVRVYNKACVKLKRIIHIAGKF